MRNVYWSLIVAFAVMSGACASMGNRSISEVQTNPGKFQDKTVTVEVPTKFKHPRYDKIVRQTSQFHAHDEGNDAKRGDTVRIMETRPISKQKRWRVTEIVERAR